MSILDKSSLVMIPSGYKEDKLYSVKPRNGDGDFTFTRASSGTRVNADGYIETAKVLGTTEEVTNGDFATDSNWSGSKSISNGQLTKTGGGLAYQGGVVTANKYYKVIVDVASLDGATQLYFGGNQYTLSVGVQTIEAVGGTSNTFVGFNNGYSTGSGSVFNSISVKQYIENDIPRLDYSGGATCPTLLLEPQRTNLATYSSDYTQSFYIKDSGITATLNQLTSPTGLNDATKISVTNNGRIYANHTTGTYATSVFIKAGTFSNFKVQGQNVDLGVTPIVTGNLDSEDYGNGWYRLIGYYTGIRSFQVQAYPDNTYSSHTDSGDYYLFGTQIETGSFPTSYIPTSGTSVTRTLESGIITSATDLIGQTQGTLYSEFDLTEDNNFTFVEINLGNSTNNRILAYRSVSNIQFVVQVGGVIEINNSTLVTFLDTNKIAVTYQTDDFKIYLNGSLVKTYTSGNIPSGFDTIDLQDNNLNGKKQGVKSLILFKEILTNDELETLTTI